jgi:hypothetical protein
LRRLAARPRADRAIFAAELRAAFRIIAGGPMIIMKPPHVTERFGATGG